MRTRASSCDFPSDTSLLVEAAVARVRQLAQLDEDVVFPPLPRVAPRRGVVILTKEDTARLREREGSPVRRMAPASAGDALGASLELDVERISPRSGLASRRSRAALVVCALVAFAFASAAFLASPAGRSSTVARAASATRSSVIDAARAAFALAR